MRVSCIIPAYNEAARIRRVIRAARACAQVDEVIVVSDGSTDGTPAVAAAAGAERVIVLKHNGGKGAAVLAAVEAARGDVLLLLDADLVGIEAAHLSALLAPVCSGAAEMAVGVFTGDRRHGLLPGLSGQRALRRSLLAGAGALAASGFGFEVALDRLARAQGAWVVRLPLVGVRHRRKREKYGTVRGLRQEIRASSDLLRQLRPRRASLRRAPPHRPEARGRRGRPMAAALLLLAVVILVLAPMFVIRPSHAARVPVVSPIVPGDRLLAVVAHPDDEVIGLGGVMAIARRAGIPVSVIVLTNGDSNRVSAAVLSRRPRPHPQDFVRVGLVRQEETLEGLRALGVDDADVYFMGFPDRRLTEVLASGRPLTSPFTRLERVAYPRAFAPGAAYTGAELSAAVEKVIETVQPTVVITHAPFDEHPDHRAAYALVAPRRGRARLYTFLVHAQGFPRPLRSAPRQPLRPPAALAQVPGWSWIEFELSPEAEQDKARAIEAHRSQISSPYLRLLLASFIRPNELFAVPRGSGDASEVSR